MVEKILQFLCWVWSGVVYITGEWYSERHMCKHEEKYRTKRTCYRFKHHFGNHRYH